jgi:hypothetical protein
MRTHIRRLTGVLLLAALLGTAHAQQVWKWVDKNGLTHYSDQPAPGATRVDLHVQTYDSEQGAIPTSPTSTTRKAKAPATERNVRITQPSNDETINGTGGTLTVTVQPEPALQAREAILLTMDGQPVAEPGAATSFTVNEVPRGTHTLAVSIVDAKGEAIAHGESVQFHMQLPVARRSH